MMKGIGRPNALKDGRIALQAFFWYAIFSLHMQPTQEDGRQGSPIMQQKISETTHRDIVVVGASAGGVEALEVLVSGLPASFPAAMLVVLHMPAESPNILHHILNFQGPLPATVAVDGESIKPGHIYVASADHHLTIEDNQIQLTRGPKENRNRPSIDVLFRSAAQDAGSRVIGVVLSGMLEDGTAGLWAIKDRGGLALVQSPEDAICASMPMNAIEHVNVDAILPVAEMAARLTERTHK
jgi:two-component system chemotaxis response regulator CheB